MKNRVRYRGFPYRIALCLCLLFFTLLASFFSNLSAESLHDYKVKAALIYKFMIFTEWPESVLRDTHVMVLGIVGHNPFGNIFDQVTALRVKKRILVIRYLSSDPSKKELCQCQAIFISSTAERRASEIIHRVSSCPVLTISDISGFVDDGGMIAFDVENRKIRFLINLRAARKAGIGFSAQMLQLAVKVIDSDQVGNDRE